MKALIVGLGASGKAALRFLNHHGISCDTYDDSSLSTPNFAEYDRIILSPGFPPSHSILRGVDPTKIIGEVELGLPYLRNQKVIGITGTNGKTTVTLLVEHVLKEAGIRAVAAGNVGLPLTTLLLEDEPDVVVLELSSYQLETMKSVVFDAGIILNITPDHLDRYSSLEHYAKTKFRLQDLLKPEGRFYLGKQSAQDYSSFATHKNIDYLLNPEYRGKFNYDAENALAAYTLCKPFGIGEEEFDAALATFEKPPHRLEFVREVEGVRYYNDSKGTNLDAVSKAVEALEGKIVLIAGGVDKGESYTTWLPQFCHKVTSICAIGEAADKLAEELGQQLQVETFPSLEEALVRAQERAKPGENVLLSPGCSSFDMFRNYEERGEAFKRLVKAL